MRKRIATHYMSIGVLYLSFFFHYTNGTIYYLLGALFL